MQPPTAACVNHPGRDAIGICVVCRRQVCPECTTTVDGINHCVSCLARIAGAGQTQQELEPAAATGSGAIVGLLGLFLVLSVLVWAMLEAAFPALG